eukprot:CAMPEP_0170468964 /NCGR_PEP_ID=MMETSP0123-20130129/11952_1 /TAXON_ID=182087 /ORGANISM="Favella ehrenbergii, Strain Fehren 1" /LENGTH=58 /DNA_ID=CAMNT_0010735675 /DNA_START=248 /DNA_END=424 /DNA_ORIENTATION=-
MAARAPNAVHAEDVLAGVHLTRDEASVVFAHRLPADAALALRPSTVARKGHNVQVVAI